MIRDPLQHVALILATTIKAHGVHKLVEFLDKETEERLWHYFNGLADPKENNKPNVVKG